MAAKLLAEKATAERLQKRPLPQGAQSSSHLRNSSCSSLVKALRGHLQDL